jgi:hypothetical protein
LVAGFHSELRSAFDDRPRTATLAERKVGSTNVVEDAYTEVHVSYIDAASILTPATTERYVSRATVADAIPSVDMIERPEELMKKPPYHLILTHNQYGKFITVQSSHQPSLELISDYLKKWTKRNHGQTTKVSFASTISRLLLNQMDSPRRRRLC